MSQVVLAYKKSGKSNEDSRPFLLNTKAGVVENMGTLITTNMTDDKETTWIHKNGAVLKVSGALIESCHSNLSWLIKTLTLTARSSQVRKSRNVWVYCPLGINERGQMICFGVFVDRHLQSLGGVVLLGGFS